MKKNDVEKINIILFGASGMVGKGVLLECIDNEYVNSILVIGRSSCNISHHKITEIIHSDFTNYSAIAERFKRYDACFFCLGISSVGMKEEEYHRITYTYTLAAAEAFLQQNTEFVFCFVSGAGTDNTEKGRTMWARVKGKTENKLLSMPFKAAYMFRPGYIHPMKGVKSKVRTYRILYAGLGIFYPLWKVLFPKYITTSINIGSAMINSVLKGYDKVILESNDINLLAETN